MADAFTRRGLLVALVEHGPSVLKTIDRMQAELEQQGVVMHIGVEVQRIEVERERLCVRGSGDMRHVQRACWWL